MSRKIIYTQVGNSNTACRGVYGGIIEEFPYFLVTAVGISSKNSRDITYGDGSEIGKGTGTYKAATNNIFSRLIGGKGGDRAVSIL